MSSQRDVVLVTVDSLRVDRCGFLGSDRGLTPAMDRLADQGLCFENAVAPAGSTRGSATSFFTGQYPIDRPTAESRTKAIRQHVQTAESLPERFSRRGYETAGFTANPWTSRFFDFDEGFDHFEDFMDQDLTRDLFANNARGGLAGLASQVVNWAQGQDMFMSWDSFYDDIQAWVDRATSPFFLWVFLVDVHMPYLPPAEFRSQSLLETYAANAWLFADTQTPFDSWLHDRLTTAYDDTIRFTDTFVDRLAREVGDETLLCVHADHGEEFGEHGTYGHGSMHEEVVHVPLFVANHPAERITAPFSLRDLPNLLEKLASGGTVDHDEPYVTARNNAGSRLVRGRTWRYLETDRTAEWENLNGRPERHAEAESGRNDRETRTDLTHRVLTKTVEAEDERRRLIGASADVATNEGL